MSGIRPVTDADLPAVAALYERVSRSGTGSRAPGLVEYFARTLNHPMADDELPSLVYVNADDEIVAFIASHVRRGRVGGRSLRIRCTGQLVSGPNAGPIAGPALLRTVLAGPQDLAITDGATPLVVDMWTRLGGHIHYGASTVWNRPFRPVREAGNRLVPDRYRSFRPTGRIIDLGDRLGRRWLGPNPPPPNVNAQPMTTTDLVEATRDAARTGRVALDLDAPFARWLLNEIAAVTERGDMTANRVLRDGRLIGWYIAYFKSGGTGQVLEIRSTSPENLDDVLSRLLHDAYRAGVTALQGRMDPWLFPIIRRRRFILRAGEAALFHSNEPELSRLIACGETDLSRLGGEWWMGHHLESIPVTADPSDTEPPNADTAAVSQVLPDSESKPKRANGH